jgi:hypothetical protein
MRDVLPHQRGLVSRIKPFFHIRRDPAQMLRALSLVLVVLVATLGRAQAKMGACCDAVNVSSVRQSSTTWGLESVRIEANASNTAPCPTMFMCIPCGGVYECGACGDSGGDALRVSSGHGVCVPCLLGDYCPEGTVNPLGTTGMVACADGKVCTPQLASFSMGSGSCHHPPHNSSAITRQMQPRPGVSFDRSHSYLRMVVRCGAGLSYRYEVKECPEGFLCPAGTSEVLLRAERSKSCQQLAISHLNDSGYAVPDDSPTGRYCPPGSSPYQQLVNDPSLMMPACREGYYCPNSSLAVRCPAGSFCKASVAEPTECTVCPCTPPVLLPTLKLVIRTHT